MFIIILTFVIIGVMFIIFHFLFNASWAYYVPTVFISSINLAKNYPKSLECQ